MFKGNGFLSPGAIAVDTCAGRGGKTLCLAMASKLAQGGGRDDVTSATTVAFDIDKRALQDLGVRLSRSKSGAFCCVAKEPTVSAVSSAVASHRAVYCDAALSVKGPLHNDGSHTGIVGASGGSRGGSGGGGGGGGVDSGGGGGRGAGRPSKRYKVGIAASASECLDDAKSLQVVDDDECGREVQGQRVTVARVTPEANGADVVLVDAPCSRLGILRRGPGTRWELRNHPTVPHAEGTRKTPILSNRVDVRERTAGGSTASVPY